MAGNHSRKGKARTVGEVLHSGPGRLGKLLGQARKLDALNRTLQSLLEPSFSGKVQVAALHDRQLVLVTSSAALATRLRMDQDSLLATLRGAGLKHVDHLQIRVAPLERARQPEKVRRQLPGTARVALERFKKDCESGNR